MTTKTITLRKLKRAAVEVLRHINPERPKDKPLGPANNDRIVRLWRELK